MISSKNVFLSVGRSFLYYLEKVNKVDVKAGEFIFYFANLLRFNTNIVRCNNYDMLIISYRMGVKKHDVYSYLKLLLSIGLIKKVGLNCFEFTDDTVWNGELYGKSKLYSQQYLSDEWKTRRELILSRDNHSCVKCGTNQLMLQVHHKRYVKGFKAWEYQDEDLETLCTKCHSNFHQHTTGSELVVSDENAIKYKLNIDYHDYPEKYIEKTFLGYLANNFSDYEMYHNLIENYYPNSKDKAYKMVEVIKENIIKKQKAEEEKLLKKEADKKKRLEREANKLLKKQKVVKPKKETRKQLKIRLERERKERRKNNY